MLFCSSEMAIVSTNKTKLKLLIEDGNEKAKKLEKINGRTSSKTFINYTNRNYSCRISCVSFSLL